MRTILCVRFSCLAIAWTAAAAGSFGQDLIDRAGITGPVMSRQPGGMLGDQLGVYMTIEGVRAEGLKLETDTLLIDTVNGKKLDKPRSVAVRGATIASQNLQPARLNLPYGKRCVLRGFESGEMIGVPPAIAVAAQEQGWKEVPASPVPWQWRSHFVALVVVEPEGLETTIRRTVGPRPATPHRDP